MSFKARYVNGRDSNVQEVTLVRDYDDLVGDDAAQREAFRWRLKEIRVVDEPSPGRGGRLRCRSDDAARLTLDDAEAWTWIQQVSTDLRRSEGISATLVKQVVGWGTLAILSIVVMVWWVIPSLSSALAQVIPISYEEAVGEGLENQVIELLREVSEMDTPSHCHDAEAQQLLDRVGNDLATAIGYPGTVTIRVINSDMINAMALPGGRILLLRGMLEEVDDSSALIGVLAHEVAHLYHRDPLTKGLSNAALSALMGVMLGDVFGGTVIAGVSLALIDASYTREAETRADVTGIAALNHLNWRGDRLGALLEDLEQRLGSDVPNFLRSHPHGTDRAHSISDLAHGTEEPLTPLEFAKVRAFCR